jgi:hypothetical protein
MKFDETRELLKLITAYDLRTTGPADIAAWFAAVGDLDLDDCQSAVVLHYRDMEDRIMPKHIRERVAGAAADRHPSAKAIPPIHRASDEVARRGSDMARLFLGAERKHLDEPLAFGVMVPQGGARSAVKARRELVLSQPEIAARLCEPPLGYQRPEQWNGFIPPEFWCEQRNDSPQRAALLDICSAAGYIPPKDVTHV